MCLDINLMGVLNGIDVMSRKSPEQHPITVVNVASILGLFNVQQPKGSMPLVFKKQIQQLSTEGPCPT